MLSCTVIKFDQGLVVLPMEFRVGHDVRYEIVVDAPNAAEAERMAADFPYGEWKMRYVSNEDVVAFEDDPRNPQAG
jgi:hypothetical protein